MFAPSASWLPVRPGAVRPGWCWWWWWSSWLAGWLEHQTYWRRSTSRFGVCGPTNGEGEDKHADGCERREDDEGKQVSCRNLGPILGRRRPQTAQSTPDLSDVGGQKISPS